MTCPTPRTRPTSPHPCLQRLGKWGYLSLGLAAAPPCVLLPPLLAPRAERSKPLAQQYWVKANLWIAIFSFIGKEQGGKGTGMGGS